MEAIPFSVLFWYGMAVLYQLIQIFGGKKNENH